MSLGISTISATPAGGISTFGGRKAWTGFVTLDASYPTGGYVFSPTLFGMTQIDQVISGPLSSGNAVARFSGAAGGLGTIQVFVATTGAEQANLSNLSGLTAPVIVIGV